MDGHAPGMTGMDLQAYAAAGIRSDHESSTAEEARAKAALGMLVQVREGSSARNLDALLPLLAANELGDDWWPYGVDANRHVLDTFLRYHHEQGLSKKRLQPEELFAPETMESFVI